MQTFHPQHLQLLAIEWQNPRELSDFRIALLGAHPDLVSELKRITNRKKEGRFFIRIITYSSIAEVGPCEILYVDFAKFPAFILAALKSKGLLISANNLYMDKTMLAFIQVDRKLSFEINKSNIQNGGLKLTSGFVGLAKKTIRMNEESSDMDFNDEAQNPTGIENSTVSTPDNQVSTPPSLTEQSTAKKPEEKAFSGVRNGKPI